jgi:arylsulfatase A-like enzyme
VVNLSLGRPNAGRPPVQRRFERARVACRIGTAAFLMAAGCRSPAPPPAKSERSESTAGIYRFDDQFSSSATVSAPETGSSIRIAEPAVWDFKDQKITWDLVRGRLGFKPDQLIVKGENASPVIVSPTDPPVDWSRYERLSIRMIAEGGSEIKIKLGDLELRQPLAPPLEWQVYRFDLKLSEASFTRPMAIMPTDDLNATVAIDYIELTPRKAKFAEAAGRSSVSKREEYRNAIFARAPSSITYEIKIPPKAVLKFATGLAADEPVTFRVLAGPSNRELFSRIAENTEEWQDAEVDLSQFGGTTQKIVFRIDSAAPDAVGFWANPLLLSRAPKNRPNVLLYVICTLRPDHMSLYGYPRDTTPFLKGFGASGVVFEDAQSQAPWTKPSVASLMTSLHAATHGLVNDTDTIPKRAATLAEQLRAAGYVTASIVANPFAGRNSGLERGFDYMMEYPVVQRNRTDAADRGTDSAAINRAILPWIEKHRDEPFFLFVQSTDPHAPYRPPADEEARFANPSQTAVFNRNYAKLRDIRAYGGGATVTRAEMRGKGIDPEVYRKQAIDRYDAEIAHNDASVHQLIEKLKTTGALENTLVVIASDHGEEFWEHGYGAHGHSLYSELIHVALLFWNPRLLPNARRIAEPVQLIDVMPTLLELANVPVPAGLQGQSLAPLLRGQAFTRTTAIAAAKLALPRARPGGGVPENLTDTFARIEGGWKLLYRPQAARARLKEIELYDRKTDAAESNDLSSGRADVAGKLKSELAAWLEGQARARKQVGPGGAAKLDAQTLERLRSLGYVGGRK